MSPQIENLTISFTVFIVIPAVFMRLGLEEIFPLKERKPSLFDNTKYFLIPTTAILFLYNGLLLRYLQFLPRRFLDNDIVAFNFFNVNTLSRFFNWYLPYLLILFVYGLLFGCFKRHGLESSNTLSIGEGIFDKSWNIIFSKMKVQPGSKKKVHLFIKSTDGDIYRGFLDFYSLDNQSNLNTIALTEATRKKKVDNSSPPPDDSAGINEKKNNSVDLTSGNLIIPASNIANIWFNEVLGFNDKEKGKNNKLLEDLTKELGMEMTSVASK